MAERKTLQEEVSPEELGQERWRGLVCLPFGPRWHGLYTAYWTSFFQFGRYHPVSLGESELRRIQRELEASPCLNDVEEFISDESTLKGRFKELDRKIRSLELWETPPPPVNLKPMPAGPVRAPGFYRDGTFFYNFTGRGFPLRNLTWLYLHEVLPGHHWQSIAASHSVRAGVLSYPGLQEGWAVYAEQLGKDCGFFLDPLQRRGWLLWDQVRSARVVLDWRIHSDGWSLVQAIDWWKENLPSQRELAYPEVSRVMRWPGQSLSYKFGEAEVSRLRNRAQMEWKESYSDRRFHKAVLTTDFHSWHELEQRLFSLNR